MSAGSSRRVFWTGQAVGLVLVLIGVRGILDARLGAPPSVARFFVGSIVLHDLVLAPMVFLAAWALKRILPAWVWPSIRNGLFVTVTTSLFAYPFIRGFGRRSQNLTVLPRDYAEGLAIVLAITWALVAGFLVVAWRRRQSDAARPVASASTSRMSSP